MRIFSIFLFSILSISTQAQEATNEQLTPAQGESAFISDDLFVYVHAGPGSNYKIIGSVNAGDPIQVLNENAERGYTEIVDTKGRIVWVESKFINNAQSIRSQLAEIQSRDIELIERAERLQNETIALQEQVKLKDRKQKELIDTISQLNESNKKLQQIADNQVHQQQMDWMIRGGIIAFVGILLGIILPHFARKKRKHEQWM